MPYVTVDLVRVVCRETEDTGWFGSADEFYVSGLVQGGQTSRAVLTRPISIDNGQTRDIPGGRIFEGSVPDGFPVRFALEAYDQDHDGKWTRRKEHIDRFSREMENKGRNRLPPVVTGPTDPSSINPKDLLRDVRETWDGLISLDDDDLLGTLAWDIPVSNQRILTESLYNWHLTADDADYVVYYRFIAVQDGASSDQVEQERERLRKLRENARF
ncbi:hypothetical protein J2809_004202 [Arthrobacter pascens]|uniref:hypothetical protein n=1 Tax=Arthrobacter pascens TaxID=1677 RepID=UPI0028664FC0|nr:hypothetical protein [Arthrobacter pascens]MDR6559819.1 hypothetical protein [Arthrobacter pascens]